MVLTPRTYRQPFTTLFNETPNLSNEKGTFSPLERRGDLRVGVFSNSFSIGPLPSRDLWPDLVRRALPHAHLETYAALGAVYVELMELLREAISRRERFSVLFIVADLFPDMNVRRNHRNIILSTQDAGDQDPKSPSRGI